MNLESLSKIISQALRHRPDEYGLKLSDDGWVLIEELVIGIQNTNAEYPNLSSNDIVYLVSQAQKKRHEIDGTRIRALHGHSTEFTSNKAPSIPPDVLFHATAQKYFESIKRKGLQKQKRIYVHLSASKIGALDVANKKFSNVILLEIDSAKAHSAKILFYDSGENDVWLCDSVPPEYIQLSKE